MPCYGPDQFYKDWVYAIAKDFHSSDGTPAQYAPGQPQYWGEEYASIPLPTAPASASLNADGSLIAVALEHDIHVYATDGQMELQQILKGHVSRVDTVVFHPKDSRALVSCAANDRAGTVPAKPTIIIWNLDEQYQKPLLEAKAIDELSQHAVSSVASGLPNIDTSWRLDKDEKRSLGEDIGKAVTTLNIKSVVRDNIQIHGRLQSSFGSQVFNSTGSSMAFLPGDRPKSNGDDEWNISIWDTVTEKLRLSLVGHRDAIMWIGFSPDDTMIASVSWDKTFRIWSHDTGSLLHTFHSNSQNWTGGFSPDSRYLAGTAGEGRFWVWDVLHGIEVLSHDFGAPHTWCRTLDWSPNGKELVIGGRGLGMLVVYDLKSQSIVQERKLSMENCPQDARWAMKGILEVNKAKYLPGREGTMILYRTTGDNGLEVYDAKENKKWRFAPAQGENKGWARDAIVLEDKGLIASPDDEAIRFWRVPLGERG